ncbi:MAG: hypothetical protein ACJAV5_000149 [Vicingaceae bacterium]|jgi:hypothetical protein
MIKILVKKLKKVEEREKSIGESLIFAPEN